MLSIENISLYFGDRPILRDFSLMLNPGERAAVVGPNGAGKSTLLKICAGEIQPDGGAVNLPNDSTLAYLPQDVNLPADRPLLEEVMSVFDEAHAALDEMRELEHRMAEVDPEGEEFTRVAHRYDLLQHEVLRMDAYSAESRAARVLHGLGFASDEIHRTCGEFSGGWQMRGALAKVLLRTPDVMLLDEPTNYLDIETMLWLEDWLKTSDATLLFVSHERAFMDNLAGRIVEVASGQQNIYKGNYSKYLELREERREQQQAAFENQQARIKQIEDFASKFRAQARRASGVQSRLKEIDRMEKVEAPPPDPQSIKFRFPSAPRSNKVVLSLEGVSKGYDDGDPVLNDIDFKVMRGEKIALVGLNGAGKSTLMKMLAGEEAPTTGEVQQGEMTSPAYFSQDQMDQLTGTNTVYDELAARAAAGSGNLVRSLAGAFLFGGDDIEKPISVLSGGEKTRLRIAKMLMGTMNCLLLDEPTNHLDVHARATLEHALRQFDGAFVLVSHDRVFVDRVATKIYEVRGGDVREFPGTYADYVASLETMPAPGEFSESSGAEPERKKQAQGNGSSKEKASKTHGKSEKNKPAELTPREARKKRSALGDEADSLEDKIMALEEQLDALATDMADPAVYKDGAKMARLNSKQKKLRTQLEKTVAKWTALGEEIDSLAELAEM